MTGVLAFDDVTGADISACGHYRYRLWRRWRSDRMSALFVMLNPSTADATVDDPTICRCIAFATAWGCGGITVVNLFAYRATDPRGLCAAPDPVGPRNDDAIRAAVAAAQGPIVAAWGAHSVARLRSAAVQSMLGDRAQCLGRTKGGAPRHPLYVPASTTLGALA